MRRSNDNGGGAFGHGVEEIRRVGLSRRGLGVLLAGLIVGIIQGLVTAYLDPIVGGAIGTVFPFIIMLLILFIRPTGMFGWKTIERV